jgi:filamentous hemagglutinin family protein
MNHIYRSIWNEATGAFVAVSENAAGGGKRASATRAGARAGSFALKALALSMALAFGPALHAQPTGGVVVAGSATISGGAKLTTINQASQNAVLNWQSFNIAAGETVRFVQPDGNAVALNRVLGAEPSNIFGNLSANGKVFLVNPNGILFGQGASVNVGGLVASTLAIGDADFMAGRFKFAGAGAGAVVNQGALKADGGYVALLGATVSNTGTIAARLGTVALAAGEAITLDVAGDGLLHVAVERGALDAIVSNGGMIVADGGQVLLSAQTAGGLLQTVVNNTGLIQAQTIDTSTGTIRLLGAMDSGTVNVGGTLDASAPNGGNGGFIDTSAAHVAVAAGAKVSTLAAHGATGTWLIDPYNLTISNGAGTTGGGFSASGDDSVINAGALQTALASTNVTVTTGAAGTQAGNITVAAPLTWSAPTTLALTAAGAIAVNAPIAITGAGGLDLTASAQAGITTTGLTFGNGAAVDFGAVDHGATFKLNTLVYKMVYSMAQLDAIDAVNSVDGTVLPIYGIGLKGNYALATNLDATGTTYTDALVGNNSSNTGATKFSGRFDGLGHTITGLTISALSTAPNPGLFGALNTTVAGGTASISNIGLVGGSVSGNQFVGALVGRNFGGAFVQTSYASTTVTGVNGVGGLVGRNDGTIEASYATGAVTGSVKTGGLTGNNQGGKVLSSYATGAVAGSSATGGLVGQNDSGGVVQNSYASGAVASNGIDVGGLVGFEVASQTVASFWDTATTGQSASAGAGAIGLSTAQLQGSEALPAGVTLGTAFAGGAAGAASGLYPSLASAFPDGRQVVAGFAGTSANVLVSVLANGKPFASARTGANGYYYTSAAPGTLASGDTVLVYADTGATYGATLTSATGAAVMPSVPVVQNTLTSTSNAALYSQVAAQLLKAEADATAAANGDPVALAAVAAGSIRMLDTSAPSFTFDQPLTVNSNLLVRTSAPNAPITVAQPITVTGTSVLTLTASGLLQVNAPISVTGAGALNLTAGAQTGLSTSGLVFGNGASLNYGTSNLGGSFILNGNSYQMVYSLAQLDAIDALDAVTGAPLAPYGTGQTGNYALATNLDASAIAYTRSLVGSNAAGDKANPLSGKLDGLGHTITGLTIAAPGKSYIGLVSTLNGAAASVSNLGLVGGAISGANNTGTLVGWLEHGTLQTSYSSAAATGTNVNTGGLIGYNMDTLQSSHASGVVTGYFGVGGAVGWASEIATILSTYTTGAVYGDTHVGGLAGLNYGNVDGSHASGAVTGTAPGSGNIGGLIGYNHGTGKTVSNSYATGAVSGHEVTGGLVANNAVGTITGSYATGAVTGAHWSGGLAGYNNATITNSYATGAVAADLVAGGLLGRNEGGAVSNSYATGAVTSVNAATTALGGLIGDNTGGTLARSFWNTQTTGRAGAIGTDNASQGGNGRGLTTAQMQTQANFTTATVANGNVNPAWNFASTWLMVDGSTTPLLRGLLTPLTVTAADASKTYDGLAYGGNNGVSYSVAPDMSKLQGTLVYAGAAQGAVNAGSYAITAGGLFSTSQQGYLVSYVPGALTVAKAELALTGTRAYDGTGAVAGSLLTATGTHGETFAVAGSGAAGNLASANVQAAGNLASVTGLTLGTSGNGGLASNYNALGTAGSAVSVTKANLTVAAGTVVKTYDGTLNATGSATVSAGTLFGHDTLDAATLAFTNPNAGAGNKTVTASGATISDGNGGANYNVSYAPNTTSTIRPYAVSLTGAREYDGTGTVAATIFAIGPLVGAETLTLSGSGSLSDANVGSAKPVSIGTLALGNGGHGGLASNYTLVGGTRTADITPATIVITGLTVGGERALDKVYDGSTVAIIDTSHAVLNGIVDADQVRLVTGGVRGSFADQNVGAGKAVTVSGNALTGAAAANYTVADPTGLTASITPATLALTGTRAYDGSTSVAGSVLSATGVHGESFSVVGAGAAGNLASRNVQAGAALASTAGLALGASGNGGLASNYAPLGTAGSAVSVTQAKLTLGTANVVKPYDGGVAAAGSAVVAGGTLFGGDTLDGGSFAFTDRNAGAGKTVTTSGVTVNDGNGGANYRVSYVANTASSINPRVVNLGGTRVYDGTATLAAGIFTLGALVGDETLALSGSGTVDSANVGSGKSVGLGTLALADGGHGGLARNYTFSGGTRTATITPASLSAHAIDQSKVVGSADPLLAYVVSGLVGGDALGATVGGSLVRDAGQDAGLYDIKQGTLASISPNYTLAYVAGRFQIVAAPLDLTLAALPPIQPPAPLRAAWQVEAGMRAVPPITIVKGGMQLPEGLEAL